MKTKLLLIAVVVLAVILAFVYGIMTIEKKPVKKAVETPSLRPELFPGQVSDKKPLEQAPMPRPEGYSVRVNQIRLLEEELKRSEAAAEAIRQELGVLQAERHSMGPITPLSDRASRYCRVADSVTRFQGELQPGQFGFFPQSENTIIRIINNSTAIVVLQHSHDKDPTKEMEVVIKGISTAGYETKSMILLPMPFEVTGSEKIGERTYPRLEAVPINPK
jgi:uncharacterized protein (UPF0333 family)